MILVISKDFEYVSQKWVMLLLMYERWKRKEQSIKLPRYFIQQIWKKQMRINILAITISYRGDLPSFWSSQRESVWRLQSYQSSCWNVPALARLTVLQARVSWSCYRPSLSALCEEQWSPDSCTSRQHPTTCNIVSTMSFKITVQAYIAKWWHENY